MFSHHVNEKKNDIAIWVGDVVLDDELSDVIAQVKSKEDMAILLGLRLEKLQRLAGQRKGLIEEQPYLIRVIRAVSPRLLASP